MKWTGDRSECLASDTHGRHQIAEAELALDARGPHAGVPHVRSTSISAPISGNSAGVPPHQCRRQLSRHLRHCRSSTPSSRGVFTNTSATGPYRGSGKPEATFVMERLHRQGRARDEDRSGRAAAAQSHSLPRRCRTRRRAAMSTTAATSSTSSIKALRLADWDGFAARRGESERRGRCRGIGLAMHCQRAGSQSERMEIRVAPDGGVAGLSPARCRPDKAMRRCSRR